MSYRKSYVCNICGWKSSVFMGTKNKGQLKEIDEHFAVVHPEVKPWGDAVTDKSVNLERVRSGSESCTEADVEEETPK